MDAEQQDCETCTEQPGQPTRFRCLYVANSVLVICLCIPVIAVSLLGAIFSTIFLVMLAIAVSVGISQYAACFRRSREAATSACVTFFICGTLFTMYLTFLIVIVLCPNDSWSLDNEMLCVFAALVLLDAYILFCGWINYQWMRRLYDEAKKAVDSPADQQNNNSDTDIPLSSSQFTLLEMMVATAVVAAITGLTTYLVRSVF